jgi:hypothetical protein
MERKSKNCTAPTFIFFFAPIRQNANSDFQTPIGAEIVRSALDPHNNMGTGALTNKLKDVHMVYKMSGLA